MFGVAGLAMLFLPAVPAFGFGWMIGGIIGYNLTRSTMATLTAAALLAGGGILQIAGAGPWGWAFVLLAAIAIPIPYDER